MTGSFFLMHDNISDHCCDPKFMAISNSLAYIAWMGGILQILTLLEGIEEREKFEHWVKKILKIKERGQKYKEDLRIGFNIKRQLKEKSKRDHGKIER